MNNKIIVFTDIDDTLIYTKGKCDKNTHLSVAALDKDLVPRSFISKKIESLIAMFVSSNAGIIPVTGRNSEIFERVTLKSLKANYKIVSHGAIVLDQNNKIVPEWSMKLKNKFNVQSWGIILSELKNECLKIISTLHIPATCEIVFDHNIPCYLCIKCTDKIPYNTAFKNILEIIQPDNKLTIHINGRNMAFLPPYTSKKKAVEFLLDIMNVGNDDLTISLGDSLTDLPFMNLTDMAVYPTTSQISQNISN